MNVPRTVVILLAACVLLGACSGARYTALHPNGGIVATPTNSARNRVKALHLLEERCPQGYTIQEEGEVPVGTIFIRDIRTEPNIFDGTDIRETSRSRTRMEWHIEFTCK